MKKKRQKTTPPRPRKWQYYFAAAGCSLIVVAICVAARAWMPADEATAQAPSPRGIAHQATASASHLPQPQVTPAASKPKVVAVVNGQSISREQLAQEAVRRYGQDVVENLVNKHLILQACQERKIQITAREVEEEIGKMAAKFGLSSERWLEMLKTERNVNPQQYRNDIIWPTIALRKLAADKLEIPREALNKEFESQHGEKRQVRMIMIKDKARCDQVHQYLLTKPEEFGKVAKDYSEDKPSAAARGLIPPVRKHVGEPEIEKTVFAMEEGKISDVIAAADHYFIFQCEKIIPAQKFDPATRQKVEADIRDQLQEKNLREAAAELFKTLQDGAQIINVYNQPELQQQHPGVAAMVNGQPLTMQQLAEECIARHGVDVLEGEINRALLEQHLKQANVVVNQQDLNAEVADAAKLYGFVQADGQADIDAWLKKVLSEDENATVDLYLQDAVWPSVALKKLVSNTVQVTKEDLQKGYEANYGDQVEVQVCVLGSQRRAQEVWEMAQGNNTEKFFGDLAYQYSIEPTSKYNFGKVPPIRKHGGQPTIEQEAFRLKPGELSGIVGLGDKFVVLRCVGHIKSENAPQLDVVQEELQRDLFEKKLRIAMSKRFDEIQTTAQIHNALTGKTTTPQRPGGVHPASAARPVAVPGYTPSGRR